MKKEVNHWEEPITFKMVVYMYLSLMLVILLMIGIMYIVYHSQLDVHVMSPTFGATR